jgi:hypothetical protein
MLINVPFKILLRPFLHITDFVKTIEVIGFVTELNLAVHLVVEGTHHDPVKTVLRMVANYCLSIVESELFVADLGDIDRCHGKLDSAFIMS